MLHAVRELFYVCLSCRKGSDCPVRAQRLPALRFHSLPHSPPASSPRAFTGRCHCCRLIPWPCSPTAVCWQPPLGFRRAPPSPHACAALALAPSPRKVGGPGWRWPWWPSEAAACCPASSAPHRGSTPPLPCCLCTCWTRRQTHTNPQLSTELESGFLEISTRESPFLGFICSVSGLPVRRLDCSSSCFSVPFPWCFFSFECKDSQVTCYRDSRRVRKEPGRWERWPRRQQHCLNVGVLSCGTRPSAPRPCGGCSSGARPPGGQLMWQKQVSGHR